MAQQSLVAVAIDNSDGPGVAKRFLVSDSNQTTVAIVDVYCKRAPMENGKHCLLFSRGFGQSNSQRVASAKRARSERARV
jgi:hypothetical protein